MFRAWRRLYLAALLGCCCLPAAANDFVRGDSNGDGEVNISDAQYSLRWLFLAGREPGCLAAADTNDDESVDISDPIRVLEYLFLGGPRPAPPFPAPGPDPTPGLACGPPIALELTCVTRGPIVQLSWELEGEAESVDVYRDGRLLAELAAGTREYSDAPLAGIPHEYRVAALLGGETAAEAVCEVTGVSRNEAPTLSIVSPPQGQIIPGRSFNLRLLVDDDTGVSRVAVDGEDVELPVPLTLPATLRVNLRSGEPGPQLLRIEVVDEAGRTTFGELAVGFNPILERGAATEALTIDISGDSGYDELEVIVEPFLDGIPELLNESVRGVRLFNGNILGVPVEVDGDRVEIDGPIDLDLFPSDLAGGRVGLRVRLERLRFFGDGESDFGFLGTDEWDAIWTGNNIDIIGTFAFQPSVDGERLEIVSDGFTVEIGSSDFSVSGFLDPIGIFDALVNALSGLFSGQVEDAVRDAVQGAADGEIVPILAEAFSNLNLDLAIDSVALETRFNDVVEGLGGLSFLFDGGWTSASPPSPTYPAYPGSVLGRAPFPGFPLGVEAQHPVDATISLSTDTLNQALAEIVAAGGLGTTLTLDDIESPLPLNVNTLAVGLEPRLTSLPGVDAEDPLAIAVSIRHPPTIVPGEGALDSSILGVGDEWSWLPGDSEPPQRWNTRAFDDSGWSRAASGFGYSSNPDETIRVRTRLEGLADGTYTSLYLRAAFDLEGRDEIESLSLRVLFDDAFVAYLNGVEIARSNIGEEGTPPSFDELADSVGEPDILEIDLLQWQGLLRSEGNVLAIQGHNASRTSSDFILVPEVLRSLPGPEGIISAIPAELQVAGLEIAFLADADGDGVGENDADGEADEVSLISYSLSLSLETMLALVRPPGGAPTLVFNVDTSDLNKDGFPDAIVGGVTGLDIQVAGETFDIPDENLLKFAQLAIGLFGPSLGGIIDTLELPSVPLPELAFDLDADGEADVLLEIRDATFAPVDTTSDGVADWICILSDLRSASQ